MAPCRDSLAVSLPRRRVAHAPTMQQHSSNTTITTTRMSHGNPALSSGESAVTASAFGVAVGLGVSPVGGVVGLRVGAVGDAVGTALGDTVGAGDGTSLGSAVGAATGDPLGDAVGESVGTADGVPVGDVDGVAVVGTPVGRAVGAAVGDAVVGRRVGTAVGASVGPAVTGCRVGGCVGGTVGATVDGAAVDGAEVDGAAVGLGTQVQVDAAVLPHPTDPPTAHGGGGGGQGVNAPRTAQVLQLPPTAPFGRGDPVKMAQKPLQFRCHAWQLATRSQAAWHCAWEYPE